MAQATQGTQSVTVIEGGQVVSSAGIANYDILIEGEQIAALGCRGAFAALVRSGRADVHRIDATGMLVFPGLIDPHVHSRDPGATHKETVESLTRGAAIGGVTTVLEMPNTHPAVIDGTSFDDKVQRYLGRSHVDFGLWGLFLGDRNRDRLEEMAARGAVGFKLFWGYYLDPETYALTYTPAPGQSLVPPPDDGEVLAGMRVVAKLGLPLAVHAESRAILERCGAAPADGATPQDGVYRQFLASRPALAEAHLIRVAASLASEAGVRLYIVHVSSEAGINAIITERARGASIVAETCPHYLTLTEDDFLRAGSQMKCYPPVRTARDREALWNALRSGAFQTLGSDHAPHTPEEKSVPLWEAPAGFPGVEHLFPLMLDHALRGRTTLESLAALMAEGPAKVFALSRKGRVAPGCDADLVIVDPTACQTITRETMQSLSKVTPYEGRVLRGRIVRTILRGQVIAEDGRLVKSGFGAFVRPTGVFAEAYRAAS